MVSGHVGLDRVLSPIGLLADGTGVHDLGIEVEVSEVLIQGLLGLKHLAAGQAQVAAGRLGHVLVHLPLKRRIVVA